MSASVKAHTPVEAPCSAVEFAAGDTAGVGAEIAAAAADIVVVVVVVVVVVRAPRAPSSVPKEAEHLRPGEMPRNHCYCLENGLKQNYRIRTHMFSSPLMASPPRTS